MNPIWAIEVPAEFSIPIQPAAKPSCGPPVQTLPSRRRFTGALIPPTSPSLGYHALEAKSYAVEEGHDGSAKAGSPPNNGHNHTREHQRSSCSLLHIRPLVSSLPDATSDHRPRMGRGQHGHLPYGSEPPRVMFPRFGGVGMFDSSCPGPP